MWARVAGLVCAVVLGAQGCEVQTCTDAGCESGVSISVSSAEPLPSGLYRVTVLLDGVATTCSRTLPDSNDPAMQCDAPGVAFYFGESFAVMVPGSVISDLYITIGSTPRRIELEIAHDDTVVARESLTPRYEAFAPNGEDCGPVCSNARLEAAPIVFE